MGFIKHFQKDTEEKTAQEVISKRGGHWHAVWSILRIKTLKAEAQQTELGW